MLRLLRGASRPPSTTFVGRARELDELTSAMGAPGAFRTLRGPGGVGKTRLALELLERERGAAQGEGIFADLTEATDAEGVLLSVARAANLTTRSLPTLADLERVVHRGLARHGSALLVLDNFEHVASHASRVAGLRTAAPALRLLVTSRAPLEIEDEQVVDLAPLDLPAADEADPDQIAETAAVRLFLDRARAAGAGIDVRTGDAASLARVVRLLDGIPLAIELCAPRVGLLGMRQLLALLERDLLGAGRGGREASPRQATLRGAIEWSWRLLAADERAALAQASVFRGGVDLDAARAVLDLGSDARDVGEVLDALGAVSLLRAAPTDDGASRYLLYESVRELAAERLVEIDPDGRAAERHARYFVEVGTQRAREADRYGDPDVRARLARESENLAAAARFWRARRSSGADAVDLALRALLALEPVTALRGPLEPYAAALDDALQASAAEGVATPSVARALLARGRLEIARGRLSEARSTMARAVAAAVSSADREAEALARAKLGALFAFTGDDPSRGDEELDRAERIAQTDPWLAAIVVADRASAATARGARKAAFALRAQALPIFRDLGDHGRVAIVGGYLGADCLALGRYEEARAFCVEALVELRRLDDRRAEGQILGFLGRALFGAGLLDEAAKKLDEAIAAERSFGDAWHEGVFLGWRGDHAFERGDLDDALRAYVEAELSLTAARERGYRAVFRAAAVAVEALRMGASGELGLDALALRLDEAVALAGDAAPHLRPAVTLYGGFLHVARARFAPDVARSVVELDRARAALTAAEEHDAEGSEFAESSDEVRLARRLLARELGTRPALFVGPDARWVQREGEARVELPRQRALRLVLLRLVEERARGRESTVARADLIAAGWPGERIRPEAARNRLHVTLSRLKGLGLRDVVVASEAGVRISPEIIVFSHTR